MLALYESTPALDLLRAGAHLIVNVSGGKDSDYMTLQLAELREVHRWSGRFILLHQDVGRMEWAQSKPQCEKLAAHVGAEFYVIQRREGDLLERIWQRARTLQGTGKPPWPSSAMRYCTSELKTAIANTWTRQAFPDNATIIHALGLRADESANRAKKPTWGYRRDAAAPTKARDVYTWLPIHAVTLDQIWAGLTAAGWEAHPAYGLGNERVSCSMCVLASVNDLRIGARQNPDTYRALVDIEIYSGFSFRANLWLADLCPDLLTDSQRAQLETVRPTLQPRLF